MNVALFFGSFNPIHIGHLIIAQSIIQLDTIDSLWFVVSPQSPFKDKNKLLPERDRLHLVNLAIEDNYKFKSSDIEFNLPQPNYTIDTLTYLKEKYPDKEFSLIMGSDNLRHLHKWKNYEKILKNHSIIVYPRPDEKIENTPILENYHIQIISAPLLNISSTTIRKMIKEKKSVKYLVPQNSLDYIQSMHFYEK